MTSKKELKSASRNGRRFIVEDRIVTQDIKEIKKDVKKLLDINKKKIIITPKENKFLIQEIPIQSKTLEICPKCGAKCSLKATDYRNLRCYKIKCQDCDHFSYASTRRIN